jgi:hypothetical protein
VIKFKLHHNNMIYEGRFSLSRSWKALIPFWRKGSIRFSPRTDSIMPLTCTLINMALNLSFSTPISQSSISRPLFHGGAPKVIILILRNPYLWEVYRPEKRDSQEPLCYHLSGSCVTVQEG